MALIAGLASAAAAGVLTGVAAPPANAETLAVAGIAVPRPPGDLPGPPVRCDYWCPDWDGRDDVVAYDAPVDRTDFVRVAFRQPREEAAAVVAQAHERLAAAGWRTDPDLTRGYVIRRFAATGDGLHVSVGLNAVPGEDALAVELLVSRGFSAPVVAAVLAALIGGTIAGWVAIGWAIRRHDRQSGAVRAAMLVTGVPMALAGTVLVVQFGLLAVLMFPIDGWSPKLLQLPIFLFSAFPPLTVGGIAATLSTLALAAILTRSASLPAPVGHAGPPGP